MNRYSLKKKMVVYHLIFIFLFFPIYYSYANPAILLARTAIGAGLARIIATRASAIAANDAVYLSLVSNTSRSISSSLLKRISSKISDKSIYKSVGGALSWAGVGYSIGTINENAFVSDEIKVATSGKKRDDGRYDVFINGKNYISDFEPSPDNPFFITINTTENGDVIISDSLNNSYPFYTYFNKKIIQGYDWASVALSYFYQYKNSNQKKVCGLAGVACSVDSPSVKRINKDMGFVTLEYVGVYTESRGFYKKGEVGKFETNVHVHTNSGFKGIPKEPEKQPNQVKESFLKKLNEVSIDIDELTKFYNDIFMEASLSTDYQGVPYSSSNAISKEEVTSSNPELSNLKKSEWFKPAQLNSHSPIQVMPSYSNNNESGDLSGNNVDFKENDIKYPDLKMPTAEQILQPYKSFFPFLQNFSLPSRNVQCPVWSVPFYGKDYKIDSHCPLIEQNRGVIGTIFALVWAFIALRKLLSA
ncbi:hypothetical protein QE197_08090 [Arsenophonus nasoniae]|uniref:Uncharacterized protein n=2 Tax=Arsenophonus nasoniae TaxID=638 RepID=A0A4P7KXI4_9GAMM|nr:hypothetical protein [Arsenophonus nasoniae]QBY43360.1 hypothetical protein ArsFIN_19270 [Arsenophonus nasoniae]WGM01631.1 hypothetical protein QE210_00435 [Arsenophonus nasoniae]WGM03044.1 hypothetical protein QE210_08265 [Arsenophonus nasoniae]WGM07359.1 hypothetical protein QE258_08960 [Arsenophonus nasoniae]WGM12230.1 hypothetical protein QE197_08090 [Arsenophonus nasoniae]